MAEEIDENDFYRENFSAESDWEVFNAQLGEILQKWDVAVDTGGPPLQPDELFQCKWQVQSETLDMLRNGIVVDYYEAQLTERAPPAEGELIGSCLQRTNCHHDLMCNGNSFGPPIRHTGELHTLARIYGLRRFVVLQPVNASSNYMKSTSEFNFFLSAAAVVAAEVVSVVAIFVQLYDPKWNFYTGIALAPALRTNFHLIGLEQAPPECRYLMGLLSLFHDKLPASYPQAAKVSVRTTYALDAVRIRMPLYVPFDHGLSSEDIVIDGDVERLDVQQFYALPHGYAPESCTESYVVYTWPELSENVAFDSEQRTDFVPSKAPLGKIYLSVVASSYLTCCLRDYQAVASVTRTLESYVGRNFSGTSSGAERTNPLDKLTEHKLTSRRDRNYELPSQAALTKRLPGPMTESELSELLAYLFPDMHPDLALFPYVKKSFKEKFDPMRIKSAVADSLVCRLSCLLATCHAHLGSLEGMAQLWAAFTRQLRLLWDNCLTVPGVASGFPDTRTCLLHQKLQMLNICVERRVQREALVKRKQQKQQDTAKQEEEQQQQLTSEEDAEEDDGEFYDCDEPTSSSGSPTKAVLSLKPEGRLKRLGQKCLLDEPDVFLYIPETQEPVPKTEDQLQDDAEVMLKLGPGSGLSTQMMCTSLMSDMEAFKAANPRGKMEDFIRWYSPKDWEEVQDANGEITHQLSVRMTTEGNTWLKVWKRAQAVPVARQRRLFDDTNEAIKVLHYLETRNMSEIYALTIIPTLHTAILKLTDIYSNAQVEDLFSTHISQLLDDLCRISRSHSDDLPNIKAFLEDLAELERRFYQYKCFERLACYPKRSSQLQIRRQFEEILTNGNSCTIVNKKEGSTSEMFNSRRSLYDILSPKLEQDITNRLISKDYVIRLDGDTKATEKGFYLGPQFMRAIITGDKLRLCGAFTESTNFT